MAESVPKSCLFRQSRGDELGFGDLADERQPIVGSITWPDQA